MTGLKSVRIQGFKGIIDASVDLEPFNILVGANNAGKSSVIQGLHFAVAILQSIALEGLWANPYTGLQRSLSPSQLIYSPTDDIYTLGIGGTMAQSPKPQIHFELVLSTGEAIGLGIRKGRNRNIRVDVSNPGAARRLSSLESPFTIFSPGLAGIAKNEPWVSDGVLLRTLARGDANLVLRNILLRLWDTVEWQLLIEDLHAIFPGLELSVTFRDKTDENITVDISRKGMKVPLELAGTGVLQTIQILSYIHNFTPEMIVLDEPDSHLHPNNQRLLCALLEMISEERGTQVLLTTHSRHVLYAVGTTPAFLWVRSGTVQSASVEDDIGVLLDIGALDAKERLSDSAVKVFVFTEDTSFHLLRCLLKASGFELDATEIIAYNGVTKTRNLRPLISILRHQNPHAKVVLHRDRDYLTDAEVASWEEEVRRFHVEPFITQGLDVESHFLDVGSLELANTGIDTNWFCGAISEIRQQRNDRFITSYVNGRIEHLRDQGLYSSIDFGSLAAGAPKVLEEQTDRFTLGKQMLKALRQKFQDEHGANLRLPMDKVSPDPTLVRVATEVFGDNHPG